MNLPTPLRVEQAMPQQRLGERLIEKGLVQAADVASALDAQQRMGGRLGQLLVRLGALSEDQLLATLSEHLQLPVLQRDVSLPEEATPWPAPDNGPAADWMIDHGVLVWAQPDASVTVACRDPLDPFVFETILFMLGDRPIQWVLAPSSAIDAAVARIEGAARAAGAGDDTRSLRELAEEAPIVELVNNTIAQAVEQRASDIHFEPEEFGFAIRLRIDGVLYARQQMPKDRFAAVASRIKLVSGMDIAERRLPQDGRFSARAGGQSLDIRASALPGVHGESIVLRLLPKERGGVALPQLGMEPDHLALMQAWSREAHGIVLVTGPTGSGKSTTLYATLAAANRGDRKIITVEDPVEFRLPGITQTQAHPEIGLTFAEALRSILRQDPDVVMVGEIRDRETAEIAIQAALTGHLVLSTVHTNDALSAFTRLIDMGLERFLVATPVKGLQAQRLVRRLCDHCAEPMTTMPREVEAQVSEISAALRAGPARWRRAVGCAACHHTGYRGRMGIYELFPVDDDLRQAVMANASHRELLELAASKGWRSLREDGLLKAWRGLTTADEVLRVLGT